MKIQDFITNKGIEKIYKDCNEDLRDVRECIKRECDLPDDFDLSRIMKKFKKWVNSTYKSVGKKLLNEIILKLNNKEIENGN